MRKFALALLGVALAACSLALALPTAASDSHSLDAINYSIAQGSPPPQSPWSGSIFLTRHDTFIVVGHDVGSSPKLFGLKNLTAHLEGFGGYGYHSQTAIAGGDASIRLAISANDTLGLGPGFGTGMHDNRPFLSLGISFSLTHRF
jgi:hypothetical protein